MRYPLVYAASAALLLAACETPSVETASRTGTGDVQKPAPVIAAIPPSRPAPTPRDPREALAEIGDRVFFNVDKSELKPEARGTVERWAAFLRQYPQLTVTIEGHADERGTREYNLALGERRMTAARAHLSSLGIDPARLRAASYGKERPAQTGSTETAWAQNRRAVLVLN